MPLTWTALSLLRLSQAFALELALGFTPGQALPTLGTVMTLGEGEPAARGLAILVHAGLALSGAWMLMRQFTISQPGNL